jgi:hypothetical protein
MAALQEPNTMKKSAIWTVGIVVPAWKVRNPLSTENKYQRGGQPKQARHPDTYDAIVAYRTSTQQSHPIYEDIFRRA